MRVRRPARLRHHAQLNDLLIGRGSFLTFARSFSGHGTPQRRSVSRFRQRYSPTAAEAIVTMPMSAFGHNADIVLMPTNVPFRGRKADTEYRVNVTHVAF
jgi:hypothetical protein